MKGDIRPDHMPINKFKVLAQGLPPITFTEVGSLEEELETVDLPDRTSASGGQTKPIEFTAKVPTHHTEQRIAMEGWFEEGKDPVSPTYKKIVTLVKSSLSGAQVASYILNGCYVCKRTTPDLDMSNEGEMDQIEWTLKADLVIAR
jgi:hypothetical protein